MMKQLLAWVGLVLILLAFTVGLLLFVAAFTLLERKLMGLQQRREGPDRVGFEGLGQPFADGLKLVRKETTRPKDSPEERVFRLAPLLSLWVALLLWAFIPFSSAGALYGGEMGLLLLLGLASLGSYGVIYAGWSSNSKYALLGAFRAVAQFVSYEILFSVLFLPLLAVSGSANLLTLVQQQLQLGWFGYLVPLWLLAFLVVLAETNRTPFDLPEAEAELVAGFNVEYSSLLFAFFFLAEYSSMGFFAALLVTLFFGGYGLPWSGAAPAAPLLQPLREGVENAPEAVSDRWLELAFLLERLVDASGEALLLALKVQLVCAAFIGVRASLPRKRFDQLVLLCWKYLFPLVLTLVLALVALSQAITLALLGLLEAPILGWPSPEVLAAALQNPEVELALAAVGGPSGPQGNNNNGGGGGEDPAYWAGWKSAVKFGAAAGEDARAKGLEEGSLAMRSYEEQCYGVLFGAPIPGGGGSKEYTRLYRDGQLKGFQMGFLLAYYEGKNHTDGNKD